MLRASCQLQQYSHHIISVLRRFWLHYQEVQASSCNICQPANRSVVSIPAAIHPVCIWHATLQHFSKLQTGNQQCSCKAACSWVLSSVLRVSKPSHCVGLHDTFFVLSNPCVDLCSFTKMRGLRHLKLKSKLLPGNASELQLLDNPLSSNSDH